MIPPPPRSTLFPYTTLFRSASHPILTLPASQKFHLVICLSKTSRSEEHTSELQSRGHLVCRLLLEKKNKKFVVVGMKGSSRSSKRAKQQHTGVLARLQHVHL